MRHWMVGFVAGALVTLLGTWVWGSSGDDLPSPESTPIVGESDLPNEEYEGSERDHRELPHAYLVELYPDDVTLQGPTDRMWVALTFDDGPDDVFTPAILDVLDELDVPATFFVNGTQIIRYPQVLFRMIQEGHAVASHGYAHVRFPNLTVEEIRQSLEQNRALLELAGSEYGHLFRPPYGALDPQSTETIIAEGYHIVLWNIDPNDWRQLPADEIADYVLRYIEPGSIVLLHSAGTPDLSGTVEAVPIIVEALREQGYEFVTVPEMLEAMNRGGVSAS